MLRIVLGACMACLLLAQGRGAEKVEKKIDLLEVIKSGAVEYHINPKMDFHDDPKDIFTFAADGTLNISGRGYGYVATKESYRDYHLVIEFKWGTKTWGARESKAMDNGILLHAYGPHGAYSDTWMASIEAQIIEGGVGDILVLSPKLPDGTELTTSVSAEIALDRDKEKIWKPGEPRQTVTKGRINWKHRDVDWVDRKGFRGANDVESPPGGWNRLEVIAKGDTLQYFVNGALVNEAFDCKPSEGRILLQTEAAEMIVRRYELHPLGAFNEKWSAIEASGGIDISVREGQDKPLSPEESMKLIQLDGPYEVQLVAAEPLVLDPVEVTWDEKGRLFVAEMRDYPLGPPNAGDPWLSRVQMLSDEDGDGRMDKAVTFADHLDHVQGLLPHNGGLIATTRTQILFLKDNDGDGKADEIRPLIKGFNPKHSQLLVSAPRWGLDGCVHFNNGLDAKEIYPVAVAGGIDPASSAAGGIDPGATPKPGSVPPATNVSGANFKWNPRTGEITPTGGKGQYGGAFDDWGHHFYCSNRNPLMFTVMPYEAMLRNPHAGITQNYEDIAPAGADTRVFPLKITHTTADAHAGTNTASCGLGVYRGHLMPELKNNVFVPDPTGQLVTRYRIEPKGASLKATRVGDRTEFFRSADEWCRPVNFTTGPDGAIYICDMYRRWIDHARFFPEEFVKANDMRQGEHQGRIWRVMPKGTVGVKALADQKKAPEGSPASTDRLKASHQLPPITPAPEKIEDLVAWLGHENAWQRETAQRLLAEKGRDDRQTPPAEHKERILFTELLLQADAGEQPDAQLIARCAAAIIGSPDDPWMAKAALSSCKRSAGHVLAKLLADERFTKAYSVVKNDTVRAFAACAVACNDSADIGQAVAALKTAPGQLLWWKPALLLGLAKLPKGHDEAAKEIAALQSKIDEVITDPAAPLDQRLAVLPLLASRKWEAVQPVVKGLLTSNQPAELTTATLALMKKFTITSTAPLIYELLPQAGPALKRDLVPMLTSNAATALELFKRMDKGEFPTAWVDVETRWKYQRGSGEMAELAKKLFGEASSDRAAVVSSYLEAAKHPGDAARGQQVFASVCVACHKKGDLGVDVGPPLSDVLVKPPEALLSDILDPNRMFEARWSAYQIDLHDGRILSGLIQSETPDTVVLAMMGGMKETLSRSAIKEMKSLDRSLMPVGLEAAITPAQMADLLAYLQGR